MSSEMIEDNYQLEGIYTRKPMVALITGITGQDGSYLAEMLLEKGENTPLCRMTLEIVVLVKNYLERLVMILMKRMFVN